MTKLELNILKKLFSELGNINDVSFAYNVLGRILKKAIPDIDDGLYNIILKDAAECNYIGKLSDTRNLLYCIIQDNEVNNDNK